MPHHEILATPSNTTASGVFTAYGSCIIDNVTPAQVWQVLLDFANYPSWNHYTPNIEPSTSSSSQTIHVEGKPVAGEMYTLQYRPTTTVSTAPCPIRIMQVDEATYTIAWRGLPKFVPESVLRAEKVQKISTDELGKTRFEVWETQGGLLAHVVKASMGKQLDGMNQGIADNLKEYLEKRMQSA